WTKPSRAVISWQRPQSANGPLTYNVVLDGRKLPVKGEARSLRIDPRRLSNGVHTVQLLVTDIMGAATLSAPQQLRIDGTPPAVRVALAKGADVAVVRVSAPSGVARKATRIDFGDGHRAKGGSVFRHRYMRPGVYRLVAHV